MGRIGLLFGQMNEAEVAYRESKRLLRELTSTTRSPDNQLGLSITNNVLSCLLAMLGRLEEAEQLQLDVVQQLEELAKQPAQQVWQIRFHIHESDPHTQEKVTW